MPRVLLVDDDYDQTDIRRLILENAGHQVVTANSADEAIERFAQSQTEIVVMDLHLPKSDEGCRLIRGLRELSSTVSIVVTTGWAADLPRMPEGSLVNHVLQKPFKTEALLRLLVMLLLCLIPARGSQFNIAAPAEMVAHLEFDTTALELAEVTLDGKYVAHVPVVPQADVFLGRVEAGAHQLEVTRQPRSVEIKPAAEEWIAYSPVIQARPDVGARFSDVPLLAYCERLRNEHGEYFQYTVIFSNEDGGTSTRALMARWGRTTDIEYVYRVWPAAGRAEIQSAGHKDIDFPGKYEGKHPLLFVTTRNNMVGPEGGGAVRYRPAPVMVDLTNHPREKVMDDYPFTYKIAAMELENEQKLRRFGAVDGQKISDPANYLVIEAHIENTGSRTSFRVKLAGESFWRSSHLGNIDYAIERSGWIRSTIELPPGTPLDRVAEVGVECLVDRGAQGKPGPVAGECRCRDLRLSIGGRSTKPESTVTVLPSGLTRIWNLRSK